MNKLSKNPGDYFDESIGFWVNKGGIPLVCLDLSRSWSRVGVLFNSEPAQGMVQLESLLVETAKVARHDERLFVMAASWLAAHHHLLDVKKLEISLAGVSQSASATMGVLLSWAKEGMANSTYLDAAINCCLPLPLPRTEPLFLLALKYPIALDRIKKQSLPLFSRWGFWHNDASLKLSAVRPIEWLIKTVPELRIRCLLGPGLDAAIVEGLSEAPKSISDLQKLTSASPESLAVSVSSLAGRGLIELNKKEQWMLTSSAILVFQLVA